MSKRTPLYDNHVRLGAKVIDFHGWEMPVQYQGIVKEHHIVRTDVGIFDVSHMGEIKVSGPDAKAFIQHLVTNDVNRLEGDEAMYTLMTDDSGGIIDDLLVYHLGSDSYWLVVNAGNIETDFEWIKNHRGDFDVEIENQSDDIALIALQGPKALNLLEQLSGIQLADIRPFTFVRGSLGDKQMLISRTGYTGEDGFEVYVQNEAASWVFDALIELGAVPCGLGARDTLRLEARLPLYGNDLSRDMTPLEAGLGMFVKLNKGPFIGREALMKQKEEGVPRKLVGIECAQRGIPRSGYPVLHGERQIGEVTSGTMSPTLQKPIALALVDVEYSQIGESLEIDIRGRRHPAVVVRTPFYKRDR